jgi:hypothetical protein
LTVTRKTSASKTIPNRLHLRDELRLHVRIEDAVAIEHDGQNNAEDQYESEDRARQQSMSARETPAAVCPMEFRYSPQAAVSLVLPFVRFALQALPLYLFVPSSSPSATFVREARLRGKQSTN